MARIQRKRNWWQLTGQPGGKVLATFLLLAGVFVSTSSTQARLERRSLRLNLNQALQIGIANSFLLKSIKQKQSNIRLLITERWRAYLPNLSVSYNRTRVVNDTAEDSLSHQIRFNIEQVVFDGGQRRLDLDLARLDYLLNRHDFMITHNELQLQIREAYLRAIAARGKILLNQKSLARANLELKHTRLERKLGFATDAQVYTVAARVREIELALQQSRHNYKSAIYDLKQILNLDFRTDIFLTDSLFNDFYLAPPRADLQKLVLRARSQRPEIKQTLASIHRQRKELEMVQREWVPRFSINAYSGRSGEHFPLRDKDVGIGFKITMPFGSSRAQTGSNVDRLQGGQTRSSSSATEVGILEDMSRERREMESKTTLAETMARHQQLNNALAIEIHRNFDLAYENWEAIRIGNGQVYFQYVSLEIQKTRYRVGNVRRADIVEAERDLVRAQEGLTDAILNYMLSIYKLEFASASAPGYLKLIQQHPDAGNTILLPLYKENFSEVRRQLQKRAEQLESQEAEEEIEDGKYIIEGIDIDD